jgi:hypothetical protein
MPHPCVRSSAALAGLLLLGACSLMPDWWTGETARPRGTRPGALLAHLVPDDDEAAVDARELAKPKRMVIPRTGSGGTPPKLNVLYVTNRRIRAYGASVIVRGTVDDDGDVVEVTVNGKTATLKDRSFTRRVPAPIGETEVVVRAEDDDGNAAETRFTIVRSVPGQRLAVQRPAQQDLASPEYRYLETSAGGAGPRLEDLSEPGVYMILLAGTAAAHFVKMPGLAQCREAVEYTENAVCTFHRGRN